jgi:hypothetical protein
MNICLNASSKKIIIMLDELNNLDLNIIENNCLNPLYIKFIEEYKNIEIDKLNKNTKHIKIINQLPNILAFLKERGELESINYEDPELKKLINKHITNQTFPKEIMKNLIDENLYSEYSSYDILLSIEKINKLTTIKLDKLNLSIYHRTILKQSDIDVILKRCLILSRVHNINDPINIKIWLTNTKKKIDKNYLILGSREINSGLTTMSLIHRETTILRKEEYKKLIIHELIHYLELDFKIKLGCSFHKNFNISPTIDITLYESYTEISACIINVILSSYECQNKENYPLFKQFITYETKFCLFQIAKILLFFGFKDITDFVKPYDGKYRFNQTTHVFSYFFVKGALLYNIDKTVEFYNSHCNIIKFNRNKFGYDKYIKLIMVCCLDKKFLNQINKIMSIIKTNNTMKKFNSMRMTCIEI